MQVSIVRILQELLRMKDLFRPVINIIGKYWKSQNLQNGVDGVLAKGDLIHVFIFSIRVIVCTKCRSKRRNAKKTRVSIDRRYMSIVTRGR